MYLYNIASTRSVGYLLSYLFIGYKIYYVGRHPTDGECKEYGVYVDAF